MCCGDVKGHMGLFLCGSPRVMRTILLHSTSRTLTAFVQSAIHRYGRGEYLAHAHAAPSGGSALVDFLEAAGFTLQLDLPTTALARYDEHVQVRTPGQPRPARMGGHCIARRLHLPSLRRPRDYFAVHRALARELRDHYRIEMPDLRPPRDAWVQELDVGGPRARGLSMARVRFRARVVDSRHVDAGPGCTRATVTYEFEDGGRVVHERTYQTYLPEDTKSQLRNS